MVSTTQRERHLLPVSDPESLGLDSKQLERLERLIESHIEQGRYPGAQLAVARNGKLALARSFGRAKIEPQPAPAKDDTLWLMFSQTKVIIAATVWQLVDRGALRFADRIADHMPEFAMHGKQDITLFQALTHQGGFPSAAVPDEVWGDHELLRRVVCDFTLDWAPGSRVFYHGATAHWVAAALIEAVTGRDYREVVREELLAPIGLANEIFVGVPAEAQSRCADIHAIQDGQMKPTERNTPQFRAAGVPGGGGYGTAEGLATFYQMLLAGGALNGARVLSPRVIQFATRSHTGDRVDESMKMPMHRGIGPHVRGLTPTIRGLGSIASPSTFGHGGAGTSYSWADPESGVSFSYLTNGMAPEPWHSVRLDQVSNVAHAAIVEMV
ncbi:MAG: beta-lactamase family protein [Chloroflexi bacterium]|nr:beta-lactamase family protein [Chloroflexota bacterium]